MQINARASLNYTISVIQKAVNTVALFSQFRLQVEVIFKVVALAHVTLLRK